MQDLDKVIEAKMQELCKLLPMHRIHMVVYTPNNGAGKLGTNVAYGYGVVVHDLLGALEQAQAKATVEQEQCLTATQSVN